MRRLLGTLAVCLFAFGGVAVAQPMEIAIAVVDQTAGEVIVVSEDGSERRIIADGLLAPRDVAASPDRSRLAVTEAGTGEDGRLLIIDPDGSIEVVADGLRFPEGVAWLDEATLAVASFSDQTIVSFGLDGSPPALLGTLPLPPTGVTPFEFQGQTGIAVATWEGPIVALNPVTGEMAPFTENYSGAGFIATGPEVLHIPEFNANRVTTWPIEPEVGIFLEWRVPGAISADRHYERLVVAGEEGLVIVDVNDGSVVNTVGGFVNPAGVAIVPPLGEVTWLPGATPTTTMPSETTTSTTLSGTTTTTSSPETTTTTSSPGTTTTTDAATTTTGGIETTTTTATDTTAAVTPTTSGPPDDDGDADEDDSGGVPVPALLAAAAAAIAGAGALLALRRRAVGRMLIHGTAVDQARSSMWTAARRCDRVFFERHAKALVTEIERLREDALEDETAAGVDEGERLGAREAAVNAERLRRAQEKRELADELAGEVAEARRYLRNNCPPR